MLIFVGITLIILFFLSAPMRFSVSGELNILENNGSFNGKFWGIKLFEGSMLIEPERGFHANLIIIINEKRHRVRFNNDKNDAESIVNIFSAPLLSNLNIVSISSTAKIGKSDNAMFTCLAIASIKALFFGVISYFKSSQNLHASAQYEPHFSEDILLFSFDSILSISIADIIYGVYKSIVKSIQTHKFRSKKEVISNM